MSIEVKNVSFSYGSIDVLHGVDFTADSGDLVAVLGPNGVGKSTFFRCMLGFLKPREGEVLLNGKDIYAMPHADVAKEIAYIPQSASPAFNYTVLDTVLMGMTNQIGTFSTPKKEHRDTALAALESLGIADLAGRGCSRISGGERQLVLLARSLVQDAKILIMDEPTANLDYGNSFRVMQRIETLGAAGYTVIGVSKDSAKSHAGFMEKHSLPFTLLADTETTLLQALGAWGEKKFCGKTCTGTLRKTFVFSEDGILERIIDKVDTKKAAEQILGA